MSATIIFVDTVCSLFSVALLLGHCYRSLGHSPPIRSEISGVIGVSPALEQRTLGGRDKKMQKIQQSIRDRERTRAVTTLMGYVGTTGDGMVPSVTCEY